MNWLLAAATSFWTWLWRLVPWLTPRPRRLSTYAVEWVDEEPDRLKAGKLYVLIDSKRAWFAAMACPGGCNATLHMNLLPDARPVWRLTRYPEGTVSLTPSVWNKSGCGCHFFLRRGKIEWV